MDKFLFEYHTYLPPSNNASSLKDTDYVLWLTPLGCHKNVSSIKKVPAKKILDKPLRGPYTVYVLTGISITVY